MGILKSLNRVSASIADIVENVVEVANNGLKLTNEATNASRAINKLEALSTLDELMASKGLDMKKLARLESTQKALLEETDE